MAQGKYGSVNGKAIDIGNAKLSGSLDAPDNFAQDQEVLLVVRTKVTAIKEGRNANDALVKTFFLGTEVIGVCPDDLVPGVEAFLDSLKEPDKEPEKD